MLTHVEVWWSQEKYVLSGHTCLIKQMEEAEGMNAKSRKEQLARNMNYEGHPFCTAIILQCPNKEQTEPACRERPIRYASDVCPPYPPSTHRQNRLAA